MSVEVDGRAAINSLRTLRNAVQYAVQETQRAVLLETERHAKASTLFQDRSGKTRASIRAVPQTMATGFIEAGAAARFLEYGTRPHEIWARGGGMLRFEVAGTVFYRRMVHHPGTAERPFMQQARDHGQQVADYAAEFYLARAIHSQP